MIDRVIVTDGDVEIRYVIPTSPRAEQTRFCHLRLDYRAGPSRGEVDRAPHVRTQIVLAACCTIAGIEVMHTIRKGQMETTGAVSRTPAEQFYALAA